MRVRNATSRWLAVGALVAAALGGGAALASGITTVFQYDAAGHLVRVADVSSDPANCGALSQACSTGVTCCVGQCTDTSVSISNCGACGRTCPLGGANTVGTCASSQCGVACASGWGDCNSSVSDGCETSVASTAAHCGGCGQACSSNHLAPSCTAGSCTGACAPGWADCNGDKRSDGCESSTYSASNCGGCGVACSTHHVAATCTAGTCDGACAAGWADCNGNKQTDGCETSIYTVSSCGGCGVVCSSSHVTASCTAGTCDGTCAAGWGDCNNDKQADGCETSLTSNINNCGACGRVCTVDQKCRNGQCVLKCVGVSCGTGLVCNPDTGACVKYIP